MRLLALLLLLVTSIARADSCSKSVTGVFTNYQANKLCNVFAQSANGALCSDILTTPHSVPQVSSTDGTLTSTTFLIDSANHRVYFDEIPAVPSGITAAAGQYAFLSGGSQLSNIIKVYNSGSGSSTGTLAEIHSIGTTGAVGGGAFVRYSTASTIGMGWHNNTGSSSWDADLLGTASGIGSGWDFSLNNKGTAANLRLQAGLAVIFGIGLSESVPEVGRFDTGGLKFVTTGQTIAIDSGTAASACAGTGTHNGTTAVTISTTCAATGARVFFNDTSEPTTSSGCWVTNIVNGTSFDVDCKSANQDANFAWWIQKEG